MLYQIKIIVPHYESSKISWLLAALIFEKIWRPVWQIDAEELQESWRRNSDKVKIAGIKSKRDCKPIVDKTSQLHR